MKFVSPAKINRYFRVIGKRHDGYHDIETEMHTIDLVDHLEIERSDRDEWSLDDQNLVVRAIKLFRTLSGDHFNVKVGLTKNIPMEAGLGGGSSNAATTLYALSSLSKNPCSDLILARWGSKLGSDVPFFFTKGAAYCYGRGEKLKETVPLLPNTPFFIAKPDYGLSTPLVYQHLQIQPSPFLEGNDLESSAFLIKPALKILKQNLLDLGFEHVQMTGSGSAFYCRGEVNAPSIKGVTFFPVRPLYRDQNRWYSNENV
ncbi:MAG: 4-(cytidine 5'-diphospho)-2-C-methyl-D-erythritol kinase [Simkaniaceae bacterium]|nr:4-(cytidine 5'-diphospho)-2-C-methyl-D-erythritol kinase [Simkaniaceae bacterium]